MTPSPDLPTAPAALRFGESGLMPAFVTDVSDGKPLMMAFMNEEALRKTLETREMHYYSRSRKELWHKGATSGHTQKVIEMRTDCDQDCILIEAEINGEDIACHTGRESCFYRVVEKDGLVIKD